MLAIIYHIEVYYILMQIYFLDSTKSNCVHVTRTVYGMCYVYMTQILCSQYTVSSTCMLYI